MTEISTPETQSEDEAAQPLTARQQLRAANQALIEGFARQGHTIGLDSICAVRLDVLVDALFAEGSMFREAFETAFEATMHQRFTALEAEVSRSKLLEGVAIENPNEPKRGHNVRVFPKGV